MENMNAIVRVQRVKLGEHFSRGGGEEGVLNYLALRKWVCTSKQGMVCKSPEFNIGCKIFLSGLEAFSRGCELATCDICVHYYLIVY